MTCPRRLWRAVVFLQQVAQFGPRSVQPAPHGSDRHAEQVRHLLVLQPFDVFQNQRLAVFVRETVQRRMQLPFLFRPLERRTRPDILARHTTWNANSAAYDLRGPELIFTHEKDVSAKQSEAKQDARVQDSNAHPRRSSRPCPSAEQGPGPAVGLSAESVTLLSW